MKKLLLLLLLPIILLIGCQERATYRVTYYAYFESMVFEGYDNVKDYYYHYGDKIKKPDYTPSVSSCEFKGWFFPDGYNFQTNYFYPTGKEWRFEYDTIKEDISLYAKWACD